MDLDYRLNEIVFKIKKSGYSLTPQRLAIIRIISESKNHPTAMDVHIKLKELYPMISLNTVYKNLAMLASLHEVKEIKTMQNSTHYDGDITAHGHAICENCGKIIDVEVNKLDIEDFFEAKINESLKESYHIRNYGIEIYGLCSGCYKKRLTAD